MSASDLATVSPFSSRDFRNAMGQFASGVVVISVETDEGPHAMTANAFMSGSLEPPLVVISVAKTARMHKWLNSSETFGVSILTAAQERDSNHFAGRRSDDHQPRLEALDGTPVVAGGAVQLAADRVHTYACGDHTMFVGHVRSLKVQPAETVNPLLFYCGKYGAISSSSKNATSAPIGLSPELDDQWW